ncbi:hypothetical protein AB0J28_02015 [Streptosporangium canum]|uniref:hypothetical protein n=1 Tax=Streptosporangium canum TaxID=324952 RepID=UPI0034234573
MLSTASHLREQNLSLREITARLVISKGKKKGSSSARGRKRRESIPPRLLVLRVLREHGEADSMAPTATATTS